MRGTIEEEIFQSYSLAETEQPKETSDPLPKALSNSSSSDLLPKSLSDPKRSVAPGAKTPQVFGEAEFSMDSIQAKEANDYYKVSRPSRRATLPTEETSVLGKRKKRSPATLLQRTEGPEAEYISSDDDSSKGEFHVILSDDEDSLPPSLQRYKHR